jgi:Na+/melibiose symporter-like transporter
MKENIMRDSSHELSWIERFGYGAGDAAASFLFITTLLFQTNFYTDVFGITAGAAATLLLAARLWDAIVDPIVGALADRTSTRWGKFRPWILWTAVPWCVAMVLAYTTPTGWSGRALLAYAMVTNMFLMSIYSMNNTPYAALGGVMTGNTHERTKLNSARFVAANLAQIVVGGFTLPLVAKFSSGSGPQRGWQTTMTIWAIVCLILFMITFVTTRERIQPPPQQKIDLRQDLAILARSSPWVVMVLMTLCHFCLLSFRGAALYNYYHHYADKSIMYDLARTLGLTEQAGRQSFFSPVQNALGYVVHGKRSDLTHSNVADVFNSIVNLITTMVTITVIMLSSSLSAKFGKKATSVVGFGLASLGTLAFYLLRPQDIGGMIFISILVSACYAPTIPVIWAIFADVADYSEWKVGRRCTGMTFATIGIALKIGLALGSSSFLWVMIAFFDYSSSSADAARSLQGFRVCSSIVCGFILLVCTVLLSAYELDKRRTLDMEHQLNAKRRQLAVLETDPGGA